MQTPNRLSLAVIKASPLPDGVLAVVALELRCKVVLPLSPTHHRTRSLAMRSLPLLFLLLASPAAAWEFRDVPICTLSHTDAEAEVVVTFDPSLPEYAIAVTLNEGTWPLGPVFAITFDGPMPLTIRTGRHIVSDDGRTMTVRDTGFGNVLDGLELNAIAVAFLGTTAAHVSLEGAAPAVRAFRACPATVTS
jgi:hypothetical protein